MKYPYISHNGSVVSADSAIIPVSHVEYAYGFGVYETIRVLKGVPQFIDDHLKRLMTSASIIGLDHEFSPESVQMSIIELLKANSADACNIKILLIGGPTKGDSQIFILCLNPLYPDKKMYRDGVGTICYEYERAFPGAKTLNMLQSYLAYREAKRANAYDALLVARDGTILEGTRTNVLFLKRKTIISPPESRILLGVMRKAVLECARQSGFSYAERSVTLTSIGEYDSAFLTSTSTKIMPIRSIGEHTMRISEELNSLIKLFDSQMRD